MDLSTNILLGILFSGMVAQVCGQETKNDSWKLLDASDTSKTVHSEKQLLTPQQKADTSVRPGTINIYASEEIEALIEAYDVAEKKLDGFRIQIFLGKPKEAQKVRAQFISKYPDVPAYDAWQSPNMKIRIGDLPSRLEAERVLRDIRKDYPAAYIVKDQIELPVLTDPNASSAERP